MTPDRKKTRNKNGLIEKALFIGVLFSYSYFFSAGEWNQISRYDLIFSLVEASDNDVPLFSINNFIIHPQANFNTGDWAIYNGDYYSNKAPGSAFLGAAVYSILHLVETFFLNLDINSPALTILNLWFINILISALPLALSSIYFLFELSKLIIREVTESYIRKIA